MLQHGTIYLDDPWSGFRGGRLRAPAGWGSSFATLREATGRLFEWEEVKEAFLEGFSRVFGEAFDEQPLTGPEEGLSLVLLRERYLSDSWLESSPSGRPFPAVVQRHPRE